MSAAKLKSPSFLLFGAFLIVYQIFASANRFFPLLIGLFFVYLIILTYERDKSYTTFNSHWYLGLIYMIFCEQMHGFKLFSTVISYLIFYHFLFDYLMEKITIRPLLLFITVTFGYLCSFAVSNAISYMLNDDYMKFGSEFAVFICIEYALVFVLFRERVL